MIKIIQDPHDPFLDLLADDPVRPEISREFRTSDNRFVVVRLGEKVEAVVCVSLQREVPTNVDELGDSNSDPACAIFYTIWSYKPGAGARLLIETLDAIREQWPSVKRFVTLSPPTPLAHKFHTRNGASVYRVNSDTVNYEYPIAAVQHS